MQKFSEKNLRVTNRVKSVSFRVVPTSQKRLFWPTFGLRDDRSLAFNQTNGGNRREKAGERRESGGNGLRDDRSLAFNKKIGENRRKSA